MGDVLLVACGGGANSTVSNAEDLWSIPMVVISKTGGTIAAGDTEALRKSMRNYRVVIPFLIMGGEVGTGIVRDVITCARNEDCKVVSVLGIPPMMEADRRERALSNLSDVVALSDCSLVFDMQKAIELFLEAYKDRKYDYFFRKIDRMIMMSIDSIVSMLDGPFFTIFSEKMYAFASYNDVLALNAVKKAWDSMLFDNNTTKGSCIIMVSSHLTTSEIEGIRNDVVMEYGIMPEILRSTDPDDTRVIVFKAVNSF